MLKMSFRVISLLLALTVCLFAVSCTKEQAGESEEDKPVVLL